MLRFALFTIVFGLLGQPIPELNAQVDLVNVPQRQAVSLTIYNSADLTLVRDRRLITFKEGMNKLQFSWANTLIDASSLEIHFRSQGSELELVDTVFPPQRSDALQWNVRSAFNGDAEIEITYFTSGLSWESHYKGRVRPDHQALHLDGDIKINNQSGEDYPNASISLIVGHINLVESIADLARSRGGWSVLKPGVKDKAYRRFARAKKLAEVSVEEARFDLAQNEKGIVKEGLSEYFIFQIEGTENIPHQWSKSLNSVRTLDVPTKVTYRVKDQWGEQARRFVRFDNKDFNGVMDKSNLGQSPLPGGSLLLFHQNQNSHLSFLNRLTMPYISMNDKCELDTGVQHEVTVKRVVKDYKRQNIKLKKRFMDNNRRVESYDEIFTYESTITNTLDVPVQLEIQRSYPQEANLSGLEFEAEMINHQNFKFFPTLGPQETKTFSYTVTVHRRL